MSGKFVKAKISISCRCIRDTRVREEAPSQNYAGRQNNDFLQRGYSFRWGDPLIDPRDRKYPNVFKCVFIFQVAIVVREAGGLYS